MPRLPQHIYPVLGGAAEKLAGFGRRKAGAADKGMRQEMTDQTRIRVLCADDHRMMREGIAAIINNQPDMLLAAEASNGREAIQRFREYQPDITLMDLRLPDISGIDALIAIRAEFADAKIVILTTYQEDAEVRRALEAGARGYLLKSMPPKDLVEAIRRVHAGTLQTPV
jgi:DNA-binding NarL/FixJ family response regulator